MGIANALAGLQMGVSHFDASAFSVCRPPELSGSPDPRFTTRAARAD
jgi:hypothetical protein